MHLDSELGVFLLRACGEDDRATSHTWDTASCKEFCSIRVLKENQSMTWAIKGLVLAHRGKQPDLDKGILDQEGRGACQKEERWGHKLR